MCISPKMKKLIIKNVNSLGQDANANLRALTIVLLKLIYTKEEN
jgi:hypothetical protein